MKRFFVTIIAFWTLSQVSFAQNMDMAFVKDDKVVNASLGFVNTIYTGNGWKTTFPPISFTGEYGIVDGLIDGKASIGAGVDVSYIGTKYYDLYLKLYKYSNLIFGIRGAFHYQFIDKLDTYAGLLIGYKIVSGNSDYAINEPVWGYYVGARYYLTDNFAIMSEIGNNVSLISIGVAYKF
ncbi:MAG: hypothetical protein LBE04_04260 [Prevotellaceae bacterium]|jgi:hypothetical protein|nr:hypothetical protein [Prevotellaceae bacterium]